MKGAGWLACAAALLLAGCAGAPARYPASGKGATRVVRLPATPETAANPLEKDRPPAPDEIPADIASVPDARPRDEPKSEYGNPDSYEVYGRKYVVMRDSQGYKERGLASWYGKKFHGKRTSSGEPYDMYAMSAAHKTLPIPCYARVTNLENGKSAVVRINDRGPFHSERIIDLSYAAALRLQVLGHGSVPVEVEALAPDAAPSNTLVARNRPAPVQLASAAPMAVLSASPPPAAAAQPAAAPLASAVRPAAVLPTSAAAPGITLAPSPESSRFLQAGLFSDPVNAAAFREQLGGLGISNVQLRSESRTSGYVHRVLIGPFADLAALDALRKRLAAVQLPTIPVVN